MANRLLASQDEELERNRKAMKNQESDMASMETEIQSLIARLEAKEVSIQEHRNAYKALEQSIMIKSHASETQITACGHLQTKLKQDLAEKMKNLQELV